MPSLLKHLSNKYISLVLILISITTIMMNVYNSNLYPLIIYFVVLLFLTNYYNNTNLNLLLSFIIMSIFTSNNVIKYKCEGFESQNKDIPDIPVSPADPIEFKNIDETNKNFQTIDENDGTGEGFETNVIQVKDNTQNDYDYSKITSNYNDNYESPPLKSNNAKNKNVINYADTIENAYSNLNKIIGSDGIKNLTFDTQNLLAEQMKLAESMKNMEPLINGFGPILDKAHGLLGNINDKTNNKNNSKSLAKNFSL